MNSDLETATRLVRELAELQRIHADSHAIKLALARSQTRPVDDQSEESNGLRPKIPDAKQKT